MTLHRTLAGGFALALLPIFNAPAAAAESRVAQLLEHQSLPQGEPAAARPDGLLLERQTGPDTLERPEMAVPAAQIRVNTADVDVTGVWFHINQNAPERARAELDRLRAEYPTWQAPADVVRAVRAAAARKTLEAGGQPSLEDLSVLRQDANPCADPELAWALLDRGLAPAGQLLDMAETCADEGVATGSLDRHLNSVPEPGRPAEMKRLLTSDRSWPPAVRRVLDDGVFGAELSALASLSPDQARALAADRLRRAGDGVTNRRSGDGAVALGWLHLHRGETPDALQWFERARTWGASEGTRAGEAQALFANASAAAVRGDMGVALETAHRASAAGFEDAAANLGWMLLDAGRKSDAARAFAMNAPTENALFGHVLALRESGQIDAATTLACDNAGLSPRLRATCADLLTEVLVAASESGRHQDALALANRLSEFNPDRAGDDIAPLVAWSRLRSGDRAGAAAMFDRLLTAAPDDEGFAAGLSESLADDPQALAAAAARHPALARAQAGTARDQAFARKQFDLAERLGAPEVAGRSAWAVGTGAETRFTRGIKGQGRLHMAASHVGAEGMVGAVRLGLKAVGVRLNSGTARPDTALGWRFAGAETSTPLAHRDVWYPVVDARLEAPDLTLFGTLSTTPINALASVRPVGEVGATIYADPFSVTARLFARPVTSTLMSFAGARDPVFGDPIGRVVDSGLGAQGVWAPGGPVSLALTGEVSRLTGQSVASTNRMALRGDIAYDVASDNEDLDYFRVGPFAAFTHHDRNIGHYTAGHGGVYSPEFDLRGGVLLDALTAEGRQWQGRLTSSVAYGRAVEAAAPRFPHRPDVPGPGYDRATTRGIAADLSIQGAALLAPMLMIGGFAGLSTAPGHDTAFVGIRLSVPLQPRAAVVSADLPVSGVHPVR